MVFKKTSYHLKPRYVMCQAYIPDNGKCPKPDCTETEAVRKDVIASKGQQVRCTTVSSDSDSDSKCSDDNIYATSVTGDSLEMMVDAFFTTATPS
jgi:hypothetical protein